MKKLLVILLTVVVIGTTLIACSGKQEEPEVNPSGIVTEDAKIKESEALSFISSQYTEEELGLTDVDKDYQFMIGSTGVEIDGKNYVKVVANVPIKNDEPNENGQATYRMETYGEYYISFDGQTILMKDQKSGEMKELENRYEQFAADAKKAD